MCNCDHDDATSCSNRGDGAACGCPCHEHRATEPMPAGGAPATVHRVKVEAFDVRGELVHTLEAVDPGPPGYLRFNIAHSQPEPGAVQTHLAIDILEREPI